MKLKCDYISFTIPSRTPFVEGDPELPTIVSSLVTTALGAWFAPIIAGHVWEVYKAKGFYHTRIFDADTKISISVGTVNPHIYCEVGGQALDIIRAAGCLENLIQAVAARASRYDAAVDFETENTVVSFIDNRDIGSFKAGGYIFSEDGETGYVGSWKSERFARVYRYHEPHPRAKFLRAEVTLRGDYAKQAAALHCKLGEVQAVLTAHIPFGWKSDLWQPGEATQSTIRSKRSDKEAANTLRWLNSDVAQAVANAHNKDLQDAYAWWEKFVLPRLKDLPRF